LNVPLAVSQADKDTLAAQLRADILARTQAGISTPQTIGFIEQAVLELLDASSQDLSVSEMTQRIFDAMTPVFGKTVSGRLAGEIASALQADVADQLTEDIAQIYGEAIGALFTPGSPVLTPRFSGVLGPDINAKLEKVPPSDIPGIVSDIIKARLDASVAQKIAALADYSSVPAKVASFTAEKEKPSASITLTVFIYQGV
jgi:hypothetical protein